MQLKRPVRAFSEEAMARLEAHRWPGNVREAAMLAERQAIREALDAVGGNKAEAARLLRTDYKTLHVKVKRYGLPWPDSPGR
jgi:DNA-binding NtrC family response regulator